MQQVAHGLASFGRGNDKMLVHMTPREVQGLQSLAMAHGGSLTINPHTGLPEAGFLDSLLPTVIGVGLSAATGGAAAPWMIGAGVGGITALASGNLAKGIQAGLGAWGGAGIGDALVGLGANSVENILANSPNIVSDQAAQQAAVSAAPAGAAAAAAPTTAPAAGAGAAPTLPLAPTPTTVATGASMPANFAIQPNPMGQAMADNQLAQNLQIAQAYGYTPPPVAAAPVTAAVSPVSSPVNIGEAVPGAAPVYQAPTITPTSRFDQMIKGVGIAAENPMQFLKNRDTLSSLAGVAAPFVPTQMLSMQPTAGIPAATMSSPNFPNYSFQQTRNPNWGQPGTPYYTQRYIPLAEGGQVPSNRPALPVDLSQNYPGSNITKSSYATLPSTDSQEVVDGYGPKINPFTGAEGMAAGGLANLADFKMYPDKNEDSGVENLPPDQLEAAAQSDDPTVQGLALLERDRRRGSGTKGYKRREFAQGGMANMPEYAAGGKLLRGPGDGMSDDIPAVIKGEKPQRAALADGEFVIPADVVSHLGNGSTEAGAKRLYAMMDKVRHARTGRKAQGRQIKAERFLPA